jgi:hypothetical protein
MDLPGLDDAAASASADGKGVGDGVAAGADATAAGAGDDVGGGDCGGAIASWVVAAAAGRIFGNGVRGLTAADRTSRPGAGATRAERGNSGSSNNGSMSGGGSARVMEAGGRGGS